MEACACAPGGSCAPGLLCRDGRCGDPLGDSDGVAPGVCGDGRIDAGEACDDGNADESDGCRSDCTRPACGDGRVDVGHSCPTLREPLAAVAGASALTWIDPQRGLASAPTRERLAIASAAAHTIATARTGPAGELTLEGHAVAETNPVALHSADVDGDGIADLLVATANKAQVSVLPGRADGTFGAIAALPLGGTPTALVAGQLDADGHTDLWTGDIPGAGGQLGVPSAARVTPWWGQASAGTWTRGAAIELGGTPRVAAIVALAGDAWPDVLVGTSDPPRVLALEGAPDRSYAVTAHMNMPSNPSVLTPVDLDRDGRLDVLVHARTSGESYVIYGGPLARFSHTAELPERAPLVALFADDVDRDGDVDLIAVGTDGRVRVHSRIGAGYAAAQELALAGPAAAALWRPATADTPWCVVASLPTLGAVQAICDAP
jgi:cysteine-rich repeat protein